MSPFVWKCHPGPAAATTRNSLAEAEIVVASFIFFFVCSCAFQLQLHGCFVLLSSALNTCLCYKHKSTVAQSGPTHTKQRIRQSGFTQECIKAESRKNTCHENLSLDSWGRTGRKSQKRPSFQLHTEDPVWLKPTIILPAWVHSHLHALEKTDFFVLCPWMCANVGGVRLCELSPFLSFNARSPCTHLRQIIHIQECQVSFPNLPFNLSWNLPNNSREGWIVTWKMLLNPETIHLNLVELKDDIKSSYMSYSWTDFSSTVQVKLSCEVAPHELGWMKQLQSDRNSLSLFFSLLNTGKGTRRGAEDNKHQVACLWFCTCCPSVYGSPITWLSYQLEKCSLFSDTMVTRQLRFCRRGRTVVVKTQLNASFLFVTA